MSKISLTPNASGTGTFTITSPDSNTNRTLTLPDADGALLTADGDGSGLTSLTAGNLTGALPAIDGSALTGISTTPTTGQVLSATAGASAGAVGTYIMARQITNGVTYILGSTASGSALYPANTYQSSGSSGYDSRYGSLAGTWRCMGETNIFNGTSTGSTANVQTTSWLRIS